MKKFILPSLFLSILLIITKSFSQNELKLNFNSYVDTYIATDNDKSSKTFDTNGVHNNRKYSYNDNLKNEFALNLAMITANVEYKNFARLKITLQAGNLPEKAYSGFGPNIQEAYIGINIIEGLWLDAGYFLTHIGGEVYFPKDNFLTSHSMVTYFEPFYHEGVRLMYENGPFTAGFHLCNGNGIFQDNNDNKSFGLSFGYNMGSMLAVSYSGIYGNEEPAPNPAKNHLLHNICLNSTPIEKLNLKAQFDLGQKDDIVHDSANNKMKSGSFTGISLQGKYQLIKKFSLAARYSNFNNEDRVEGFGGTDIVKGSELAFGVEYKPIEKSYIRFEMRMLNLDDKYKYFLDKDSKPTNSRLEFMINFGVLF